MLDRIVSWLHCLAEQRAFRLQSEVPRSRISSEDTLHSMKPAGAGMIRKATLDWLGGYGGGVSTRSHPELGRESPQRRWYCVLRHGRVGRRQAYQTPLFRYSLFNLVARDLRRLTLRIDGDAGWSSPVARQAHNLKVGGSNPPPATNRDSIIPPKKPPWRNFIAPLRAFGRFPPFGLPATRVDINGSAAFCRHSRDHAFAPGARPSRHK
jgi:hypothetical protein